MGRKHLKIGSDAENSVTSLACTLLLGASAKLRKATVSFFMSVRPFAWKNSAPTGRIFMKFCI
jgi:hypothetical protein